MTDPGGSACPLTPQTVTAIHARGDTAVFDAARIYRYQLSRAWIGGYWAAAFIMLNPSRADERRHVPTIRRCIRFAQRGGCEGLEVVNLFAYRASNPTELWNRPDLVGPENDGHILEVANRCQYVVAAWGTNGVHQKRDQEVIKLLKSVRGINVLCLGQTKEGHPRHPLYVPYKQRLEPFAPCT